MADQCVDCNDRPKLRDLGSCYSETFAVRAKSGASVHLTLRLCLRCGARFSDRTQIRDYLRARLSEYALQVVPTAST